MKYHDINTLLANEGISECFEIGCIYAVEDRPVNYRSCDCPSHDENNCPRLSTELPDYEHIFESLEQEIKDALENASENGYEFMGVGYDEIVEDMSISNPAVEGVPLEVLAALIKKVSQNEY
jgi:hypothetical protein